MISILSSSRKREIIEIRIGKEQLTEKNRDCGLRSLHISLSPLPLVVVSWEGVGVWLDIGLDASGFANAGTVGKVYVKMMFTNSDTIKWIGLSTFEVCIQLFCLLVCTILIVCKVTSTYSLFRNSVIAAVFVVIGAIFWTLRHGMVNKNEKTLCPLFRLTGQLTCHGIGFYLLCLPPTDWLYIFQLLSFFGTWKRVRVKKHIVVLSGLHLYLFYFSCSRFVKSLRVYCSEIIFHCISM